MSSARGDQASIAYFERGSGPPLLLVHGLMITGDMFEPVVGEFVERHRVIAPDLRGDGRSRNLPGPYSVECLAGDLPRLLDRLGVASTAVLGYSHGGAVALELALDEPARCDRLILACSYAFNMATMREQIEGRLAPFLIKAIGMRRFATLVMSLGLKRVESRRAQRAHDLVADQDSAKMVEAWRAAMAFDARARLSEVRCPTLIVAGARDRAIPSHHAHMLRDGIPNSRLVVVEDADHALLWTHPMELVRIVEGFLAKTGGS
jgi:pimeloyl-ACP methyl ester carboxylesterase